VSDTYRFMIKGLWLSIPVCGLSVIFAWGNINNLILTGGIKELAMMIIIPMIIGLPWNLLGTFLIIIVSIDHGGSDMVKMILFVLGSTWMFLSLTLNGVLIRMLANHITGKEIIAGFTLIKPWNSEE